MTTHPVHEETRRLLGKLGTTSDEVAQSLIDLGITGRVGFSQRCPIANYLADHLDGQRPSVDCHGILFNDGSSVENPPSVTQFVWDFDNGYYRELIDRS